MSASKVVRRVFFLKR